jgi:hypothetical protein
MAVPVYWGLLWLTLCSSIAIIQAALDALAKLQRQGAFPPITVDEPPGPGANPKSNALPLFCSRFGASCSLSLSYDVV